MEHLFVGQTCDSYNQEDLEYFRHVQCGDMANMQ